MKTKSVLCIMIILAFIFCYEIIGKYTTAYACEKSLRTEEAKPGDISGTYTLLLYGARFSDDLETVAIFDLEGDKYHFDIYAPDFDYKVKKGLSAKDALAEAQKFVSFHNSFFKSILSRILDNDGKTIGYELRPLYYPFVYGISDVLDVHYFIKEGGRIKVFIKLEPSIERLRFPAGTGHGDRGD